MHLRTWPFQLLPAALALVLALPAHADVYRWVDEDGVTQYSEHPPPDTDAERVDTTAGIAEDPEPPAAPDDDTAADDAEDDEPQTVEEFCDQVREQLEIVESDDDVRVETEGGELEPLEGDELEARRDALREQLEQHCS